MAELIGRIAVKGDEYESIDLSGLGYGIDLRFTNEKLRLSGPDNLRESVDDGNFSLFQYGL
jgi:hypothetical protein